MPEEKKMNTEDTEIVDIDTSGPEVDVELKEDKEEKKGEQGDIVQPIETPEEKPEVQEQLSPHIPPLGLPPPSPIALITLRQENRRGFPLAGNEG